MTAGTLTRADIAARINQQIGLSRNESATIVESILDHMSDALANGQNVKISGFGTFVLRSEEHTSELQSLMRISYAVFCLNKNKRHQYSAKRNKYDKLHTLT